MIRPEFHPAAQRPIPLDDSTAPLVYDRVWVLEQLGDDEQLLNEAIEVFLADAARHEEDLSRAFASGECSVLCAAAHSIRNTVDNFGAGRAHDLAQRLEEACRRNRRETLPALTQELLRALAVLKRALYKDFVHCIRHS